MEITTAERVAKGVQYMDEYGPTNWVDLIDLDTLDIGSTENCIFGQVFRNYEPEPEVDESDDLYGGWHRYIGTFRRNTDHASARDYGLDGPFWICEELTEAWADAIMERRNSTM